VCWAAEYSEACTSAAVEQPGGRSDRSKSRGSTSGGAVGVTMDTYTSVALAQALPKLLSFARAAAHQGQEERERLVARAQAQLLTAAWCLAHQAPALAKACTPAQLNRLALAYMDMSAYLQQQQQQQQQGAERSMQDWAAEGVPARQMEGTRLLLLELQGAVRACARRREVLKERGANAVRGFQELLFWAD